MEEEKEIKEMNQTQQPPRMVNNISFCYEGEKRSGNDNKRKQHFLLHKNCNGAYTDGSKSTRRKVGFAAVFTDITRRRLYQKKPPSIQ